MLQPYVAPQPSLALVSPGFAFVNGRHLRVHRIGACVRNNEGVLTPDSKMTKGLSRELSLGRQRFSKAAVAEIEVPVIFDQR